MLPKGDLFCTFQRSLGVMKLSQANRATTIKLKKGNCHLKFICIKSHISTYKYCTGIVTNRVVINFNIKMVSLCLEMMNQPSFFVQLGELGPALGIQISQLSKLPLYCEHQLSTLCLNENRPQ